MVPSFLKDAANRGWKVARLDALLKSKDILGHLDGNHGNLYPRSSEFVDSGIKYISANALIDGKVNLSKSKYLTSERGAQFKKGVAIDGDVLFAHNATVGPVALLTTNDDYVILSTSLTYYRCALDKVDNKYLVQYMASPAFVRQYEKIMKQTTRNQIPITAQRDFYFVLPPLPEQRKIAQILSTWDRGIATTEKLIDASKQQKKALMQQLLTGKKRLVDPETGKAFEGGWERNSFKKILRLDRGSSPRPIVEYMTNDDNGVNWIKIGDTKDNDQYINATKEKITKEGAKKSRKVSKGEVIVSNSMSYGKPYILNIDGYIHDGWFVIRNFEKSLQKEFLLQLLGSELVQSQYKRLAAGGVVANISSDLVYSVKVNLPSISEQQKIASVLTAADKEIELLEAKLAYFKQEKKALMQQLLTGKRRVSLSS